ncbi:MAG: hypothetical protein ABI859_20375 [Pseudomonadota bacterium]
MHKKMATASNLSSEMNRMIRERARGPYAMYFHSSVPCPVALNRRDEQGCNWTVFVEPSVLPGSVPFLDLIISKLMGEYDLVPG